MKPELARVKQDVETINRALGFAPSIRREWLEWMKRDHWLNLGWCLPGAIIIVSALLPFGDSEKYFGLVLAQWTGLLVAAVLVGIAGFSFRQMTTRNGRPDSLVREYRRMNGLTPQGTWLNLALLSGLVLYFVWGKQYGLPFQAFWSGLFIFLGSSCLVTAVASRTWLLLGWAVPFLAYGLFQTLFPGIGKMARIPFGMMFIAVALSFSGIQAWQIRRIKTQNGPH